MQEEKKCRAKQARSACKAGRSRMIKKTCRVCVFCFHPKLTTELVFLLSLMSLARGSQATLLSKPKDRWRHGLGAVQRCSKMASVPLYTGTPNRKSDPWTTSTALKKLGYMHVGGPHD